MLKNEITFIILFLFSITHAQVHYERNDDNSLDFYYSKEHAGNNYIVLTFKNLSNTTSSSIIKKNIKGYNAKITTLFPIKTDEFIDYSYTYRTLTGNINSKPNFNFKYILPFKNKKTIKAKTLTFLGKKFGSSAPKNWISFQFLTEPNDTVYAIRKGIVVQKHDEKFPSKNLEYAYKRHSNFIKIEHNDGTLAIYEVLKENSILVEIGDVVYPTSPIAIAGTYDKVENSQLRLSIYYLNKKNIMNCDFDTRDKKAYGNQSHLYNYINPYFYVDNHKITQLTPNKTYTSYNNNKIIELEMTKRELRKRKKLLKKALSY